MNKKIIALCGFIFFGSSVSIKPLNFSWGEDDSPFSFSFDSSASVGAAESPDCAVSDEVAAVVIGPKDKITTLQEELRGLKASRTF